MWRSNVVGLLWCVQHAAPRMAAAGGGAVVTVGSRTALTGSAPIAHATSKAAVVRATELLAEELRPQRVRVNCVLPSVIDTPANRSWMSPELAARAVPPAAVAKVIAFLAGPDARGRRAAPGCPSTATPDRTPRGGAARACPQRALPVRADFLPRLLSTPRYVAPPRGPPRPRRPPGGYGYAGRTRRQPRPRRESCRCRRGPAGRGPAARLPPTPAGCTGRCRAGTWQRRPAPRPGPENAGPGPTAAAVRDHADSGRTQPAPDKLGEAGGQQVGGHLRGAGGRRRAFG